MAENRNEIQRIADEFNAIRTEMYLSVEPVTVEYDSDVLEGTDTEIKLLDYNSRYNYNISTNDANVVTLSRVGDIITYKSGDMIEPTEVEIYIQAVDPQSERLPSVETVVVLTVYNLSIINDDTDSLGVNNGILTYENSTMSTEQYDESTINETSINFKNNKIRTSKLAYNAIAYTGNGTSQDIVNGIEMNLAGRVVDKLGGQIITKNRENLVNPHLFSTLNKIGECLITSGTNVLTTNLETLSKFSSNGFSIGSNGGVNTINDGYVSWSNRTTKHTNGYTNHGKFYEIEFNPNTGFVQGVFEGSGTAGHEIPHGLGVALDFWNIKNLEQDFNWATGFALEGNNRFAINSPNGRGVFTDIVWSSTINHLSIDALYNNSGEKHYFYGYANIAGKVKVGTYTGDGVGGFTLGSFGFDPAYVIIKRADTTGDWLITDIKRGNSLQVLANTNAAESSLAGLELSTDTVTITGTNSGVNASGGTYIYIAIADHAGHETTLYTGNGVKQNIVTGLNMDVEWINDGTGTDGDLVSDISNPSLIAKYEFEGDATDSAGNYDDVATDVTYDVGKFGQAGIFNGISSYVNIGIIPTAETYSVMFKFNSLISGNNYIIATNDGSNGFGFRGYSNELQLVESTGGSTSFGPIDENWHHLVLTKNGDVYIDGIRTSTSARLSNQSDILYLGRNGAGNYFNGLIDQVEIYNKVLTEEEVQSLYRQNSSKFTKNYPKIPGGLSWIKCRSTNYSNHLLDSIRGATYSVNSDTTNPESRYLTGLTSFNIDGISLGDSSDNFGFNQNANTYINWSWGTTHQYSGVTNHGKPYACAWNPISGFTIVKYIGSGTAGHEIPHHLGKALDIITSKNLSSDVNWQTNVRGIADNGDLLLLSTTSAITNDTDTDVVFNNTNVSISTDSKINTSNDEYIMYGWANSMTQEVLEYTGTGEAGNFIMTSKKPAYIMTKRKDSTSDWRIYDNQRDSGDGWLEANTSDVEVIANIQPHITFNDDGFNMYTTAADVNALGGKYLAFVMFETDEDTQGSKYYG